MKIVLYSGGSRVKNHKLNLELIKLTGKKTPSITYIPVTHDEHSRYFDAFKKKFKHYGIKKIINFPIDNNPNKKNIDKAMASDIVFIQGGNTFELLENLINSNFDKKIKDFVKNGGVLAGESAGAIVLSKDIHMASIPSEDKDENDINTRKRNGLNLVPFHFSPHYSSSYKANKEIREVSLSRDVYCAGDGCGVVIDGKNRYFIGKVRLFEA